MQNLHQVKNLNKSVKNEGAVLIAVSKNFPSQNLKAVYDLGIRNFGENYLSEAIEKIESLKGLDIKWNFIGRLQTGNINKLIDKFHIIQTLYKEEHIKKIDQRTSLKQKILIQIQDDLDSRESGLKESDLEKILSKADSYSKIDFGGLMFMPPPHFSEAQIKDSFDWARSVFVSKKNRMKELGHSWDCLSMGMSGDYQIALKSGSTHVRLGTAIFGKRN